MDNNIQFCGDLDRICDVLEFIYQSYTKMWYDGIPDKQRIKESITNKINRLEWERQHILEKIEDDDNEHWIDSGGLRVGLDSATNKYYVTFHLELTFYGIPGDLNGDGSNKD